MGRDRPDGTMPLAGWGNYPVEPCYIAAAAGRAELRRIVVDGERNSYISRGLGRAYGDSSLNCRQGVIVQTPMNRLLAFDEQTGILHCEAGVSFEEIIDVFLPRGWFLPTTPGTKFVTVGGAIAADVHGKNQHVAGTFGAHVLELELLTAAGEVLTCSPQASPEIFSATLGGMGLTGCILSARFRLARVESAYVDVQYRRTANLQVTLDLLESTSGDYQHSVAWIDCLSRGASAGRSVLMLANDAPAADLPTALRPRPLILPHKRGKSVPFQCPSVLLNPYSVRVFNSVIYRMHKDERRFVDLNTFYYPLDSVLHWNRIYGRRGFVQYQVLFPRETALKGLLMLLEQFANSGDASFLAVLKSTGPEGVGMLSFPKRGFTLALDMPYKGAKLKERLARLDQRVVELGGRLYMAKDATTTPEIFAAMYPRLAEFQALKAQIDPHNRFQSSQARRLGIIPTA